MAYFIQLNSPSVMAIIIIFMQVPFISIGLISRSSAWLCNQRHGKNSQMKPIAAKPTGMWGFLKKLMQRRLWLWKKVIEWELISPIRRMMTQRNYFQIDFKWNKRWLQLSFIGFAVWLSTKAVWTFNKKTFSSDGTWSLSIQRVDVGANTIHAEHACLASKN